MDINAADESFHEVQSDATTDDNNNNSFICDVCGSVYQTKCGLKRHIDGHSKSLKYKCRLCSCQFANRGHYEGHVNSHNKIKPFKCNVCSKRFCFKSALLRHRKVCTDKAKKPDQFVCNICAAPFNRIDILKDHMKGKHENIKPYRCSKCCTSFAWRSSLSKHFQSKRHINNTSLLE